MGGRGGKRDGGGGGPAGTVQLVHDLAGKTWRAGTKRRVGVYTSGRHSLNLAVETLGLTRSQISDQDGRRQGRKGFRESEAEGGLEERQGWTPVPRWKVRCCNL